MDVFELKSGQRDYRSMLILVRTGIPCAAGIISLYFYQKITGGSQFATCVLADIVVFCILTYLHRLFRLCTYHMMCIIMVCAASLYLAATHYGIIPHSRIIESILAYFGIFITAWCIALMTIIPAVKQILRKRAKDRIWLK